MGLETPASPKRSCNAQQRITQLVFTFAEIAAKQGHDDVSQLTPTDIAIEVLYFSSQLFMCFYFCEQLFICKWHVMLSPMHPPPRKEFSPDVTYLLRFRPCKRLRILSLSIPWLVAHSTTYKLVPGDEWCNPCRILAPICLYLVSSFCIAQQYWFILYTDEKGAVLKHALK